MPSTPDSVRIAAVSLNQTVGDWAGNGRRVREGIASARAKGARLVVLPELCLSGYSLGDRLLRPGTLERSWASLEALLPETKGLVALIGLPVEHAGSRYNAVAVVADGVLVGLSAKEHLAVGDVEYENRWYTGWTRGVVERHVHGRHDVPIGQMVYQAPGIGCFGVEICEDMWHPDRPGRLAAAAGARILCNPSASWFTLGKHAVRRDLVARFSAEDDLVYVYCSQFGCDATRLIFDGSTFIANGGDIVCEGDRFRQGDQPYTVYADIPSCDVTPLPARADALTIQNVDLPDDPSPRIEPEPQAVEDRGHDPSLHWLVNQGLIPRMCSREETGFLELELALATGLNEYLRKNGIPGFCVALSGGRDSAMVAYLVGRAFRYRYPDLNESDLRDHVTQGLHTAYLATENSSETTRHASATVAADLGATHHDVSIQPCLDAHLDQYEAMTDHRLGWSHADDDVPLQNVQARLRSSMIWTLANTRGLLLLATSNKSEAAVGYTTMDGDTSGGVAPIADVLKTLVSDWLAWAGTFHGWAGAQAVSRLPATAELRPAHLDQTDEGDLMPYAVLDAILTRFVQHREDPLQIFQHLWPEVSDGYEGQPRRFSSDIRRFVALFCQAQWKRERLAISFRVSAFDLDPKGGFRFPPVQAPFHEELDALDDYVNTLVHTEPPA